VELPHPNLKNEASSYRGRMGPKKKVYQGNSWSNSSIAVLRKNRAAEREGEKYGIDGGDGV